MVGCIALPPLALAGCASNGPDSATPAAPVVFHGLRLSGGYVPQPASPDVAAAYLTIVNTTGQADRLERVVSNVTKSVTAMTETDSGSVGSMTDLSSVSIPAHGTYRFRPDHAHLMLQNPTPLVAGDRVALTLTFSTAGTVTIELPVIPLAGPSMSAMPGMSTSS